MNQGLELPTEFDIDLSRTDLGHHPDAKSRVIDPVSQRKAVLHCIFPEGPIGKQIGGLSLAWSAGGGRSFRSRRSSGALAKEVVALTRPTLDPFNLPLCVEGCDDVFTDIFAFSAMGVDIAP
jgi:hypothetical protein